MLRWIRRGLLSALLLCLLVAVLLGSHLYTYQRLTDEATVARVQFTRAPDGVVHAWIQDAEACPMHHFEFRGEQWQLDARFIKWKYWATLLGIDPLYRLDSFHSRGDFASSFPLAPETLFDLGRLASALGPLNFIYDTDFGSAVYNEVASDVLFVVYRGQSGLLLRREALPPRPELEQGLLRVTVAKACGS